MEVIYKSLVLIISGLALLRISGRKSISQMTISQTVVMISIGSIIIQPIIETSILRTIIAASIFVLFMIMVEYLQLKFDFIETLITGKSKVIIENGNIVTENLKKLRMTTDLLEMRLRQKGVENISDVKTATLEVNGQIGYELKRHAKPLTIGEFEKLMGLYFNNQPEDLKGNIFDELKTKQHNKDTPSHLQ